MPLSGHSDDRTPCWWVRNSTSRHRKRACEPGFRTSFARSALKGTGSLHLDYLPCRASLNLLTIEVTRNRFWPSRVLGRRVGSTVGDHAARLLAFTAAIRIAWRFPSRCWLWEHLPFL